MDNIKLIERTINMLNSMIKNKECHTARSIEMKNNSLIALSEVKNNCDKSNVKSTFNCGKCFDKKEVLNDKGTKIVPCRYCT